MQSQAHIPAYAHGMVSERFQVYVFLPIIYHCQYQIAMAIKLIFKKNQHTCSEVKLISLKQFLELLPSRVSQYNLECSK